MSSIERSSQQRQLNTSSAILTDITDHVDQRRVKATSQFYEKLLGQNSRVPGDTKATPTIIECEPFDLAAADALALDVADDRIPPQLIRPWEPSDDLNPDEARELKQTLWWQRRYGSSLENLPQASEPIHVVNGSTRQQYRQVLTAVIDPGVGDPDCDGGRQGKVYVTKSGRVLIGPINPREGNQFGRLLQRDPIAQEYTLNLALFQTLSHISTGRFDTPPIITFDYRTVFGPVHTLVDAGVSPSQINKTGLDLLRKVLTQGAWTDIVQSGHAPRWRKILTPIDPTLLAGIDQGERHDPTPSTYEVGIQSKEIHATVTNIRDRFGNVIGHLESASFEALVDRIGFGSEIWIRTSRNAFRAKVARSFADLQRRNEVGVIRGSKVAGRPLEIVVNGGSARDRHQLEPGDRLTLALG